MTTIDTAAGPIPPVGTNRRGIPLPRIVANELRKMFDTRSGFWLLLSIAGLAVLTSGAIILWAPREELTYRSFATAISVPMTIVLPIIAILSVTSEWSQRSGLTTFTLVPHRGRVLAAKLASSLAVAVVSIPFAFAVGALGNRLGTAIAGVDPVWDMTVHDLLQIVLANVLAMLAGFTLGVLVRSSAGAIAVYFVYAFVLPTLAMILATSQDWFRDLRPWVDFDHARTALVDGALVAEQWAHLAVTGTAWLLAPLVVGVRLVVRSEVK